MSVLDIILLVAIINIWLLMLLNILLTVAGYRYYMQCEKETPPELTEFPFVSVLVPAHNEAKVIAQTVEALLRFDYPADRYEIIVVNDNSSDASAQILAKIQSNHPQRRLQIINTDAKTGAKGKSNALNIGFAKAAGEYIAVYDADNTPEREALKYLVAEIVNDDTLGAVIGKFRTRNRNTNMLTRFINIETIAFQWMAQAGRWNLMKLCTIPGTNFVIRRKILEDIGGWDVKAVAEDTEISYRIYLMGYRIKLVPRAVTWEQEPQTLSVWFRQRLRWVRGNIYVLIKNFHLVFKPSAKRLRFDLLYSLGVYFLLLTSLLISDWVLIGNALGLVHSSLAGFSMLLWVMAFTLFVVGTFTTVTTEKGELRFSNLALIALMYFTYAKLWMVVAVFGLFRYIWDAVFVRETKWYKTERF